MAKSKYAAQLRERGLKPISEIDPELSEDDEVGQWFRSSMKELEGGLNRRERRKFRAQAKEPTFIRMKIYTLALDEKGHEWMGEGNIDLTSLGFIDVAASISTLRRTRNPIYN